MLASVPVDAHFVLQLFARQDCRSGRGLLLSTTYSVFDIHPTATLDVKGLAIYGFKKYRGSRLETSLWMDAGAEFALGSKQAECLSTTDATYRYSRVHVSLWVARAS